ncbi:MAG TPA: hypothetical protein VGC97_11035 [Pyrinomonadaceae bacterium]|jgi:hypothetical protein
MKQARQKELFEVGKVREDFPMLRQKINGKPLVYPDTGGLVKRLHKGTHFKHVIEHLAIESAPMPEKTRKSSGQI